MKPKLTIKGRDVTEHEWKAWADWLDEMIEVQRQKRMMFVMREAQTYADKLDVENLLKSMNVRWTNG